MAESPELKAFYAKMHREARNTAGLGASSHVLYHVIQEHMQTAPAGASEQVVKGIFDAAAVTMARMMKNKNQG